MDSNSGSGGIGNTMTHQSLLMTNGSWDTEALEQDARRLVARFIDTRDLTTDEIAYIAAVDLRATSDVSRLDNAQLEKLRRMCQLWDIQLRPSSISSHRRFIGPVIVGFKRLLFSAIGVLLKDMIRQQREFNGAAIAAITALAAREGKTESSRTSPTNT
jgi:hypothetical protein